MVLAIILVYHAIFVSVSKKNAIFVRLVIATSNCRLIYAWFSFLFVNGRMALLQSRPPWDCYPSPLVTLVSIQPGSSKIVFGCMLK